MTHHYQCLIVEDEAISALSLKVEFENAGLGQADIVASGEQALAYLENNKPDIVLMDLRLAGQLDGFEVTLKISEDYAIPVIVITGCPDKRLIDLSGELNKVSYLVKPLRTEMLLNKIRSLLEAESQDS